MKTTDEKAPEQRIRQRAFQIYLDREEHEGNEATDWFQAENELNPSKDYPDNPSKDYPDKDEEEGDETTNWFQNEHILSPLEEDV